MTRVFPEVVPPSVDCERECGNCGCVETLKDHCFVGHYWFTCKFCKEQIAYDKTERSRNADY